MNSGVVCEIINNFEFAARALYTPKKEEALKAMTDQDLADWVVLRLGK